MRLYIFLLLILIATCTTSAQDKYEREKRIKSRDVPELAIGFMEESNVSKIKWYRETRIDGHSYEAKTKVSGRKYSIEFDSAGVIEDIEIEIKWEDISEEAQVGICSYLESFSEVFRIRKIQSQFTGSKRDLLSLLNKGSSTDLKTAYELVADIKKEGERYKFEFLFSSQGELLSQSRIIDRITDNLEY